MRPLLLDVSHGGRVAAEGVQVERVPGQAAGPGQVPREGEPAPARGELQAQDEERAVQGECANSTLELFDLE